MPGRTSGSAIPLVATVDDKTHQMTITRNGKVGRPSRYRWASRTASTKPRTARTTSWKFADIVMDSSTYGVPVNSAEGYKLKVQWAVRIDNSGAFVHSAPWSVGDQASETSVTAASTSPRQREVVLRQLRQRRSDRRQELRGLYNNPDGADDWQWQLS